MIATVLDLRVPFMVGRFDLGMDFKRRDRVAVPIPTFALVYPVYPVAARSIRGMKTGVTGVDGTPEIRVKSEREWTV